MRAVVLGVLAALGGAAVWVAVGAATKHEIGFVARRRRLPRVVLDEPGTGHLEPPPGRRGGVALVAVVVGDLVLDIVLQAQYEGVGLGEAFSTVLTSPSIAKDLFAAYFTPIDLLLWLLAASVAYRGVRASVVAAQEDERVQPGAPPAAGPAAAPVAGPYGPQA